jgi:alpha-galactosidase/6-phospho-beta-glucosidase family protein
MKYIKLWESWQRFNKNTEDRKYRCTLEELFDWYLSKDWQTSPENIEEPEWIEDYVSVNDDAIDSEESKYYIERFIFMKDEEIEVSSQMIDGIVFNSWWMDGERFTLIANDWPFVDSHDHLTPEEDEAYARISSELKGDVGSSEISTGDFIDFVRTSVRQKRIDPRDLTSTGFRNWLDLQRGGAN